jgi:hypothetical protein
VETSGSPATNKYNIFLQDYPSGITIAPGTCLKAYYTTFSSGFFNSAAEVDLSIGFIANVTYQ